MFDPTTPRAQAAADAMGAKVAASAEEVLKASEYPIEATCGGMALCATCYIEVVQGLEQLEAPTDAELDMLDTLPSANAQSRLACQVKISSRLQDVVLQVGAENS